MKYKKCINTKIGDLVIIEEDNKIIGLEVNKEVEEVISKDTVLLKETAKQIEEYFAGKRKNFNVPLNPKGTEFMQKVWTTLQAIPYGEVKTYGEIAKEIGHPKAARAVGMANHRNPIPLLIPCHRVIGRKGKLVGYALGLDKKEFLLGWEKKNV